jgi:hypothetical protein
MFFANSCEGLNEIYDELSKFTGTADDTHDDIVSALSILADQFGAYADMESKINFADTAYVVDQREHDRYDQIYCLGSYAGMNEMVNDSSENPVTAFELSQMETKQNAEVGTTNDPLGDLF